MKFLQLPDQRLLNLDHVITVKEAEGVFRTTRVQGSKFPDGSVTFFIPEVAIASSGEVNSGPATLTPQDVQSLESFQTVEISRSILVSEDAPPEVLKFRVIPFKPRVCDYEVHQISYSVLFNCVSSGLLEVKFPTQAARLDFMIRFFRMSDE